MRRTARWLSEDPSSSRTIDPVLAGPCRGTRFASHPPVEICETQTSGSKIMTAKPRIVVIGGGFGGLEAAFYLRHKLGDRADLTLVSDRPFFCSNRTRFTFRSARTQSDIRST
jgi:hypothetical protein